jgi:hypothetical protein
MPLVVTSLLSIPSFVGLQHVGLWRILKMWFTGEVSSCCGLAKTDQLGSPLELEYIQTISVLPTTPRTTTQ